MCVRAPSARSQGRFRELSAANKPRGDSLMPITQEELSKHTSRSDCWLALEGVVYDVSSYLRYHPGGAPILLSVAGREAGAEFRRHHPWVNYSFILENCRVGILERRPGVQTLQTTLHPPSYPVPAGLPSKTIRDPLRLALNQGKDERRISEEQGEDT
ncbi:hypothetical protein Esti_001607 [Eimeria stiedai]